MNRNMQDDVRSATCSPAQRHADGTLSQTFCFDDAFIGFAGHFPGYPIVPAVAQMLAAQLLIEEIVETPLEVTEVSHAKFLLQLMPQQAFRVSCREKKDRPLCYDAKVHLGDELAASFRLTFVKRDIRHA